MVIYCYSILITTVRLFYNIEWWYYYGMAVNYCDPSFITLTAGANVIKQFYCGNLTLLL
jgi:hypothetical protein